MCGEKGKMDGAGKEGRGFKAIEAALVERESAINDNNQWKS